MKGVILAGGYGTRFLPVTKTIPKEMLPLINKPSIECIIDEFAAAGITETLIITSRRKRCLDDYFDREVELETEFIRSGKSELLAKIEPAKMDIFFARQQTMNGTGHALLLSRPFVGNEPFIVAYPDDLHFAQGDQLPLAAQLSQKWQETGKTVLAGLDNPPNLERYGVLKLAADGVHVQDIVEKPAPGTAPSHIASIGRYLYTPDIFEYLEEGWRGHLESATPSAEYYHVYALNKLMQKNRVVYHTVEGLRLDTGAPAGYLRAILEYAAGQPELVQVIRDFAGQL